MSNKALDSYKLKWIAIITMVIDHTGAILFNDQEHLFLRLIGRISFPIFCFLLVEGFFHTRNVYKYMMRLAIFAVLSEYPFDMMYASFGDRNMWMHQNIFMTLVIGLAVIKWIDLIHEKYKDKAVFVTVIQVFVLFIGGFLAEICHTDYGFLGVMMIVVFYLNRGHIWNIFICLAVIIFFFNGLSSLEMYALLALPIIAYYNGEKGRSMKYFFYAFYPLHIVALCLIKYYMF